MPKDKLFFIAILPSVEIMQEIIVFKEDMHNNYDSSKALKVIPHITLKAPFKVPPEECGQVLNWFKNIAIDIHSFPVTLENFGSFDNKLNKVIYVKPIVSTAMATLQKNIVESFSAAFPHINMSTYEHYFKPHMTIAYRDLTPLKLLLPLSESSVLVYKKFNRNMFKVC